MALNNQNVYGAVKPDWLSSGFKPFYYDPKTFALSFAKNKFPDLFKLSAAGDKPSPVPDGTEIEKATVKNAVPSTSESVRQNLEFYSGLSPIITDINQRNLEQQLAYNEANLRQLAPWLRQASAEATARNLAASKAYAGFKEGLPSVATSTAATASLTEAERLRSLAQAYQAARPIYQGQTFSVA